MKVLFQKLTPRQINRYALILSAGGIPFHTQKSGKAWNILVDAGDIQKAETVIYESLIEERPRKTTPTFDIFLYPKSNMGLWMSMAVLAVHMAAHLNSAIGRHLRFFPAAAAPILNGEYYRTITALLIHADGKHLLGNMAGFTIFGTFVCRIAGPGLGLFLLLLCGGLGNLLNAMFYQVGHVSVGSSTAVFGAIGILAGYQGLSRFRQLRLIRHLWLPIGASLGFFIFLSYGKHTDITAHFFGMVVGIVVGLSIAGREALLTNPCIQAGAGILSAGMMTASMIQAW